MHAGSRVLLIIGGGIAAYKCLELIRNLRGRHIAVTCVMTDAAKHFVTPLAVQTLAGEPVHDTLFSPTAESEIGHIALSRSADLVVVCPASANLLARMRAGIADDLATTLLLATDTPVLVAPAMNVRMWTHPATQDNVAVLRQRGIQFVGPDDGDMACGEFGPGRLAEPDEIATRIAMLLAAPRSADRPLVGRKALVTAGPTHEPIDPVRFIANRSSGKQGYAIAAALHDMGADVTLVSGPTTLPTPAGVQRIDVETAREMLAACRRALPVDIAVCVAAVGDWRPTAPSTVKLKKTPVTPRALELIENPDILAEISRPGPERPQLVVGFAAETDAHLADAVHKRRRKGCDWLVANDVSPGADIFGSAENQVSLVSEAGVDPWPRMPKNAVAARLATLIARHLVGDG